jgi:hypothetical protein
LIRRVVAFAILAAAIACGGGPSQPTPSPLPAPTPPTPPPSQTDLWIVAGRVIALGDARPVGNARVTSEVGSETLSDGNGGFRVSGTTAPASPSLHRFTVDAAAYMPRTAYIRYRIGARTDITFDLIPLAAPFSIDFYRALVRNGLEGAGRLEPLRRWTSDPRFYVRTVDQTGKPIEPEVVATVLQTIPDAVRQFSGGRLTVAQLETGTETRPATNLWINVHILRDPASEFCGRSKIGANPGEIELWDDRCACGSVKIRPSTIAHEVGHALGFWHVPGDGHLMAASSRGCPAPQLSEQERFHAALAYQRPPGNVDPDADPPEAFWAQLQPGRDPAPTVSCPLR